ncbi:Mlr7403 protein [uncultured Candidatus Thioglobus sp.]|nr:Mlr7403 protein [uncultured Candidatus Thioglobus sp.]
MKDIDEEQIATLKNWWDKNKVSLICGLGIGLTALFGWRGWQDYATTQARDASKLYEKLVVATKQDNTEVDMLLEQLMKGYKSTPYAIFSALLMAKKAVEKNDLENAKQHLEWALENAEHSELQHLIRLRLARLFLETDNNDEALSLLEAGLTPESFAPSYLELQGDILVQKGDLQAAKNLYNEALENQTPYGNSSILQKKIDDIGNVLF